MTAIEKAIADIVAVHVAQAEKRIMERLSATSDRDLTFTEACKHLNMSSYTLRKLCLAKRVPHRTVGAEGSKNPRYVFSSISLDRWKKEQEMMNYRRESSNE
ncbi:helix-turn-helix domain-containing protein [Paenibacillus solani]|uniref:helix-turn-helix domain-containing protein n=1 Tax=Paenibacillus solani TaxID=1705565 RepID=UPI003D2BA363